MSDKYTPTTDEVRTCAEGDTPYTSLEEGAFDRWRDKDRSEAQVEALREAADDWHTENAGTAPRMHSWLHARADRISRETGIDNKGESNG